MDLPVGKWSNNCDFHQQVVQILTNPSTRKSVRRQSFVLQTFVKLMDTRAQSLQVFAAKVQGATLCNTVQVARPICFPCVLPDLKNEWLVYMIVMKFEKCMWLAEWTSQ